MNYEISNKQITLAKGLINTFEYKLIKFDKDNVIELKKGKTRVILYPIYK